jgi:antitoxin VapB
MALNIKNGEADRLARELAAMTGTSLTETVVVALRSRLATIRRQRQRDLLMSEIFEIQAFVRALPDRGVGVAEDDPGYRDIGLPH